MKKIVLAFDSFKGSLTAVEAVQAASEGVKACLPDAEIIRLPLADGGEGTAAVLSGYIRGAWVECMAHDPLMRSLRVNYALSKDGATAIIEMAAAAGLMLLEHDERNPMHTTTFGVGEMMLDALERGCKKIIMGIGGSATNDCGIGMLTALGARFFDCNGEDLFPNGGNLLSVEEIDLTGLTDFSGVEIEVVCDVNNPLYGKNGASFVYAAQKGANQSEIELLDRGLRKFASLCGGDPEFPGAGAAGGLGYGLMLLAARLKNGVDVVLDAARFDDHLAGADLVITGEGKIDSQTLNGKLPCGVLQRARKRGIPVIALAGKVEDRDQLLRAGFCRVVPINPKSVDERQAMNKEVAAQNLKNTIIGIFRQRS